MSRSIVTWRRLSEEVPPSNIRCRFYIVRPGAHKTQIVSGFMEGDSFIRSLRGGELDRVRIDARELVYWTTLLELMPPELRERP